MVQGESRWERCVRSRDGTDHRRVIGGNVGCVSGKGWGLGGVGRRGAIESLCGNGGHVPNWPRPETNFIHMSVLECVRYSF